MVPWLVKKFSAFVELKGSLLLSQDLAIGPSSRAYESSPHLYALCLISILVLSSDIGLYLSSGGFFQVSD
jgi:hypothetical protein